jgi:hypothetical protein
MRRQLTAYLSEEEYHRLRDEADERGITLSRYVKERLFQGEAGAGLTLSDVTLAATEKGIIQAMRTAGAESLKPIALQLTTLLTMLDHFALSVLSHLPEIPEAQRKTALASGQRRHRGWRTEVEETLKRMQVAAVPRSDKGEAA